MAAKVEKIEEFKPADLSDLVQATEDAIRDGIGFNWVIPPGRDILETYWKGVVLVPDRVLFCGRLDGTISASAQLLKPGASKETTAFAASLEAHFVAPWARGHGLAKMLLLEAEREARKLGYRLLKLSVRETQEAAIQLYEEQGFVLWGTLPYHEYVGGNMVAGRYYYKTIDPISGIV